VVGCQVPDVVRVARRQPAQRPKPKDVDADEAVPTDGATRRATLTHRHG
jgi:hypothetical protein